MELLVRNQTRNPEPDWQYGDIITVQEDGWAWGKQEDPRTRTDDPLDLFIILVIPGKALGINVARNFTAYWEQAGVIQNRRIWRVVMTGLPAGVQAQLAIDGVATIGWGVLKQNLLYVPDGVSTGEDIDPENTDPNS
jgi:hypothetical protein